MVACPSRWASSSSGVRRHRPRPAPRDLLQRHPLSRGDRFHRVLITRTTNDIQQVQFASRSCCCAWWPMRPFSSAVLYVVGSLGLSDRGTGRGFAAAAHPSVAMPVQDHADVGAELSVMRSRPALCRCVPSAANSFEEQRLRQGQQGPDGHPPPTAPWWP